MSSRAVRLQVAGQSYKVVSSASEDELQRLADAVSAKIYELTPPGKMPQPQAVVLAAIALAHELEEERERRSSLERRARDMLRRALVRIDQALETAADS